MKHIAYIILLTLIFVSCGTDGHHFKLDGRLLHMNQGEFYVYSTDGIVDGMDTIKVQGGRFTYEIPCEKKGILFIVFPNFSEQPVFAEPGKTVDVQGDAARLKELQVEGTKDNELMSKFRKQIASASPPEILKHAAEFITDYPASIGGRYLVMKYFLQTPKPNYKKAKQLINVMLQHQPEDVALLRLKKQIPIVNIEKGSKLPIFTASALNGNSISSSSLTNAKLTVIQVWASWNYSSLAAIRQLNDLQKQYGTKLKVVGISLDASKKECKETLDKDSIRWTNICDEKMFASKLVRQLGFAAIPDNIILKNGCVMARGLDTDALEKKVKELL